MDAYAGVSGLRVRRRWVWTGHRCAEADTVLRVVDVESGFFPANDTAIDNVDILVSILRKHTRCDGGLSAEGAGHEDGLVPLSASRSSRTPSGMVWSAL